jgi:membrane fusion protein (multidrug efflux system)
LQQAQIDLGYTDVRAPIAGIAGRALKVEGSLANAPSDSLLTTMAQTDPLYINFSIPEDDYTGLRKDIADGKIVMAKEGLTVGLQSSEGAPLPQQGKVDFNDYKTDPATGGFAMRATIANKDSALAPGQFVRVTLSGLTRRNVVTVPQRAVLDGPMGKYVYVPTPDAKGNLLAQPQPVKVGQWVKGEDGGNDWIVYDGLKDGQEIVVDGTARIFFPGAPVSIVPPQAAQGQQGQPGQMPPPPATKAGDVTDISAKPAESPATDEAPAAGDKTGAYGSGKIDDASAPAAADKTGDKP